jgi:hypothetical protein
MIKKVKLIFATFAFMIIHNVNAQENRELDKSPENCKRVGGMSVQLAEMIAQTIQVSVSSVQFIRGEHGTGPYGSCAVVVDTPKGVKRCSYLWILQKGNNKPFAATMSGPGAVPCQ